jgi:hypothetical protein
MEGTGRIRLVSAAVVVSLAIVTSLVTSTTVASRAYVQRGEQQTRQSRTLEVTGSAKKRITSDLALWSIRVEGEGKTLEEAFQRLSAATGQVRVFLAGRGFPEGCVSLGPIHTTVHYRRDDKGNELRDVAAYVLGRGFAVRTTDLGAVAAASGDVTELLKSGAHVESRAPQFIYTGLQELKIRMIGEATANARERAEVIARESRCRIGAVKDARAGVLQITPPWSTETSAGGMNDTSSIEKEITSVVHLTLQIESR